MKAVKIRQNVLVLKCLLSLTVGFQNKNLMSITNINRSTRTCNLRSTRRANNVCVNNRLKNIRTSLRITLNDRIVSLVKTRLTRRLSGTRQITRINVIGIRVQITLRVNSAFTMICKQTTSNTIGIMTFTRRRLKGRKSILANGANGRYYFRVLFVWLVLGRGTRGL